MKDTTIIRVLLTSQGLFETTLARRLNKSKNTLYNILHRKTVTGHMRTDIFVQCANALDYQVVVLPNRMHVPSGAYILTTQDEKPVHGVSFFEDFTPEAENLLEPTLVDEREAGENSEA